MGLAYLLNTKRLLVQTLFLLPTKIFRDNLCNGPLLSPSQRSKFKFNYISLHQSPDFDGGSGKVLNTCGIYLVISADRR